MKTELQQWLQNAHPSIRFALVGCSGFVVDLSMLILLYHFVGLDLHPARALAFFVAASNNWFLNRQLTFIGQAQSNQKSAEWLRFVASAIISALPNLGAFYLLMQILPQSWTGIGFAMSCGILLGLFSNYQLARHWVFRTQT